MNDADIISIDELKQWQADHVTRKLLKSVMKNRTYILNGLERGEFLSMDNPYITHASVAKAWGNVEALNVVIDMMQEKNDGEPS